MGTQKTTKLTPYSRSNKAKIELQREALARSAETAKKDREVKQIIKNRQRQRALDAFFMGRGHKESFDWKAFNSRPVYIPLPGAPGFNHF